MHPLYVVAIGHRGMSPPCSLIASSDLATSPALDGITNANNGTWHRKISQIDCPAPNQFRGIDREHAIAGTMPGVRESVQPEWRRSQ
jgi:hypothetical protein